MSFYELEFPVLNLEQLVINEYIFIYVSKIWRSISVIVFLKYKYTSEFHCVIYSSVFIFCGPCIPFLYFKSFIENWIK